MPPKMDFMGTFYFNSFKFYISMTWDESRSHVTPSQDPIGVGAGWLFFLLVRPGALQVLTSCSASQGAQFREESAKLE